MAMVCTPDCWYSDFTYICIYICVQHMRKMPSVSCVCFFFFFTSLHYSYCFKHGPSNDMNNESILTFQLACIFPFNQLLMDMTSLYKEYPVSFRNVIVKIKWVGKKKCFYFYLKNLNSAVQYITALLYFEI